MIPPHTLVGESTDVVVTNAVTTIPVPARANGVLLQARSANAKVTVDGTTPSATHGWLVVADAIPIFLPLTKRFSVKAFRSASTDVNLTYQFVKANNRY